MILYPTYFTPKVTDINIHVLNNLNVKGVILDVDDTLVAHKIPYPNQEITEWINSLKLSGIKIILLSNNFKNRVQTFASTLNIPYISFSMKPFTFGLKKAIKKIDSNSKEILVVGDQIFTDILAANILGVRSILVEPIKESTSILFKIKRFFENHIKQTLKSNPKFDLKNLYSALEDKN